MASESEGRYIVVVNQEEQYSIWPETMAVPGGWRACGQSGTQTECLRFIESTWKDLRPLSLRRVMGQE
jgi:MbtH protein